MSWLLRRPSEPDAEALARRIDADDRATPVEAIGDPDEERLADLARRLRATGADAPVGDVETLRRATLVAVGAASVRRRQRAASVSLAGIAAVVVIASTAVATSPMWSGPVGDALSPIFDRADEPGPEQPDASPGPDAVSSDHPEPSRPSVVPASPDGLTSPRPGPSSEPQATSDPGVDGDDPGSTASPGIDPRPTPPPSPSPPTPDPPTPPPPPTPPTPNPPTPPPAPDPPTPPATAGST